MKPLLSRWVITSFTIGLILCVSSYGCAVAAAGLTPDSSSSNSVLKTPCGPPDKDNDGWGNDCDNCPGVYNPNQEYADGDGIGDSCCCIGRTGNVNHGVLENPDLVDLSSLVSYLQGGGFRPGCPAEANVDGRGIIDLADLALLVRYLVSKDVVLPNCPNNSGGSGGS